MSALAKVADELGNPFVTDPNEKAGQDFGGEVADGLAVRGSKGPMLVLIGTAPSTAFTIPNAGSQAAIYTDTLDVTDASLLTVEIAFYWQATGGAETENANVAVGLEESSDGFYWFPVPVINRAEPIAPATMFRDDTGTGTVGVPSTTGGLATALTTFNAPLPEDLVTLLPAPVTAAADTPIRVQRAIPFNVAPYHYVRVVVVPIFDEPPDRLVPLLLVRAYKAVSP